MHWLFRFSSWRKAGIFLAISFTLQAIILLVVYPKISTNLLPLDIQMGLTADAIDTFLSGIGSDGRTLYLFHEITLDALFPLTYAIAYTLLIAELVRACGQLQTPLKYLVLLPFAIALFDLLENIHILVAVRSYPAIDELLVKGLAAANMAKHLLSLLVLSTLAVLFFWLTCNRFCRVRILD